MTGPGTLHDGGEALPPAVSLPPPADPGERHAGGEGPALLVPPDLPAGSPGQEDVLGLRISAALIDLVLLGGLFTVMACVVGRVSAGGGSFSASLSPGWAAVFVAAALLYYFALEAWSGQTVGKRLLGVQVYGPGRARPSAGAVAGRTLLRVVDFLPVLYLAGFVTVMATGARRQRLGDLAARTAVARAAPARHRGLAAVPLALVLLAAAGVSAYRAASPGGTVTYRGHGVWFDYPASWQEETYPLANTSIGGAPVLWTIVVGPGTPTDGIVVGAYRVNPAVTAQNIDAVIPVVQNAVRQAGLTAQGTPEKVTMAGLPGLRVRVTGTAGGTRFASTRVLAFNGTTEYVVDCQSTAGMAAPVGQACDQVTGSFHVSGAAPGAVAPATSPPAPAVTSTTAPSAAGATPGRSPAGGTAGSGGLAARVVRAPAGFALWQTAGGHNGPMSAAGFNQLTGTRDLAAKLHFVRGYLVIYQSNSTSDAIAVTLFQFATPAYAAAFTAAITPGAQDKPRADPVIPGAVDFDSTAPSRGTYDHAVIAAKGNLAFVIDEMTGSAARVAQVQTMARQQYAAL